MDQTQATQTKSFKYLLYTHMQELLEIGGAVLTGILFLTMSLANLSRLAFIVPVTIIWLTYIAYRIRKEKFSILKIWGFHTDGIGKAFFCPTCLFVVSVIVMIMYVTISGKDYIMNYDILILLALYPFWGIVQQLLVQAMLTRNMFEILTYLETSTKLKWVITILLSSILFGIVHINNLILVAGTFGLALVWTPCYLVNRNIIPLGLYHGWIGAFFYFLVLNDNPLRQL